MYTLFPHVLLAVSLSLESYASTFTYRQVYRMSANRPLNPQPLWGVRVKKPPTTVFDVVSVLGRYSRREDFYKGKGYTRPEDGNFLTNQRFYDTIKDKPFVKWPQDKEGKLVGTDGMSERQIAEESARLKASVSELGVEAVFTLFAKGATNGMAYPGQVDEEMSKWLSEDGTFDLEAFENALSKARFDVALGWVLYIGFQFGAVYVIFFYPIMRNFFPGILYQYHL